MNPALRRLGVVVAILLAALLASSTWIQFADAEEISDGPGNSRQLYAQFGVDRGDIVVAGTAVAGSEESGDEYGYQRVYSQPTLYAHATGFYSILFDATGVEQEEDEVLSGSADQLFYRRVQDLLTGADPRGGSVELTLDPAAQQAAVTALGSQRGAVVALEPSTGRILAMVSNPSYDPNTLASHDLGAVQESWRQLLADESTPLNNRALTELYPPGSVFKLVTAAAALETGTAQPDTVLPGPATLQLPLTDRTLGNFDGTACGANDQVTLRDALRISCNTAFADLGIRLGSQALAEQARAFGFGTRPEIPMPGAVSDVPADLDDPQTAIAGIGQGQVTVTPLQVAMVTAAIANDGVVMSPQLVEATRAPDLDVLGRLQPSEVGRAVSEETAAELTGMMQGVVDSGTGTRAQIPGVAVAGKSGTAQAPPRDPHAWFTAFAPVEDPRVAVAVLVENGGSAGSEASGGRTAAPVARAVMEAVLGAR